MAGAARAAAPPPMCASGGISAQVHCRQIDKLLESRQRSILLLPEPHALKSQPSPSSAKASTASPERGRRWYMACLESFRSLGCQPRRLDHRRMATMAYRSGQTHRSGQRWRNLSLGLAALALGGASLRADPAGSTPSEEEIVPMKTFVFLFRQSARPLTEADLKRRAEEVHEWALRQNSEGHKLDPRMLEAQSVRMGSDGIAVPAEASGEQP